LFNSRVVRVAVEFNDKLLFGTREVGGETVDWMLTAKVKPFHLMGAEQLPQSPFIRGLFAPQAAGTLNGRFGGEHDFDEILVGGVFSLPAFGHPPHCVERDDTQ